MRHYFQALFWAAITWLNIGNGIHDLQRGWPYWAALGFTTAVWSASLLYLNLKDFRESD